jgi:hypothetical protein
MVAEILVMAVEILVSIAFLLLGIITIRAAIYRMIVRDLNCYVTELKRRLEKETRREI